MNRTTKEILKEIALNEVMVAKEDGPLPVATRSAFEIAINKAKERIISLKQEYGDTLLSTGTAIFVDGSAEKVAELLALVELEGVGAVVSVDANVFYERIANGVWPSIDKHQEFNNLQLMILFSHLQQIGTEVGYHEDIEIPQIKNRESIVDFSTLVRYTKELVNSTVSGRTLNEVYLKALLVKQAIASGFSAPTFGVVIVNSDEIDKVAIGSLFMNTTELTLESETKITKQFIETQFKKAKMAKTNKTTNINTNKEKEQGN